MRNVLNSINMLGFISAKPKNLSSNNCQARQRGREMYKIKKIKKGEGKLSFATWKKNEIIFFKNKNNQFSTK